jgi:lipopolysaccharide transport system ATP-binding protein
MSEPIIRVENLGKRYTLRHHARSGLLRDRIATLLKNPFAQLRSLRAEAEEFWALREVSFQVKPGEVLGIIGRNGAGKSTLLKLLSRITEPTTGRISIQGRVASLLEVGTGFHGELSGRENIFLNGAILGMTRAEIRRKFDEIVAFAEVEKFLDTAVKHYSSGMYVRLAFAVAAHLEPEILIVDEVLAVGDLDFQKKCLGKMESVTRNEGRTVLYVSHNLASVRQLCTQGLLLEQGCLVEQGEIARVLTRYASSGGGTLNGEKAYKHIRGDGRATISKVTVSHPNGDPSTFGVHSPVRVTIHFECHATIESLEFFLLVHGEDGDCVLSCFQSDSGAVAQPSRASGTISAEFTNPLMPGRYLVSAGIFDQNRQFVDWVEFAESFSVDRMFHGGRAFDQRLGRVSVAASWTS